MRRLARRNPLLPSVDYQDAQHYYFIHNGAVYPVASAPSDIFSAAVLARKPHWQFCAEYEQVLKSEMDLMARWWLLNCLAEKESSLTLYASRGEAERECCTIPRKSRVNTE